MAGIRGNKLGYALQALVTVIVALATLEATFLIQYFFSRKTIYEEATRRAEGLLNRTNLQMTDVLDQVETTVRNNVWPVRKTLATPDSLWALVHRIVDCNPTVSGSCIALTENYYPKKGRFFAPYAYRAGERIDTAQLGKSSYGYPEKEWYVKALETGDGYWSEPYFDEGGGEMLMTTYSIPVRDREGNVAAVLTADLSLDWLTDLVESIRVYPKAFSVLVSRTGQLMVCPVPDLVMKKTVQEVAPTLKDSTAVRDVSLAMLVGEQGSRQIMYKGEKEYVFFAPIERTGWSMAVVIPHKEIYGDVRRVGLMVILLQVLGLLLMSYILYASFRNQFRLHDLSDKKNRMESELSVARNIQMAMLPKTFPTDSMQAGLDMSGLIVPAKEVGGDLLDYFIREEKLFFCIGDVSGKGIPAALVMAVIRSLFRAVSAHEVSPQRIISSMNDSMADTNDNDMFVTFFLGVLDLQSGHVRYCNAGHNAPVRMKSGSAALLDVVPNLPLGVVSGAVYQEQETDLACNEGLFLYTDGLTEAENTEHGLFGERKMLDTVLLHAGEKAEVQRDAMADAVKSHSHGCDPSDDLTLMVVRFTNPNPSYGPDRRLVIHNKIDQIPKLAAFMDAIASEARLDRSLAMNLHLALEEVVSNVILYAYPAGTDGVVDIEAYIEMDRLEFIVTDSGVPFDPTAVPAPDLSGDLRKRSVGGLGIYLVRSIMDQVTYARKDGKNILSMTKKR